MRLHLRLIALFLCLVPALAWGQGIVDGHVVNGSQFTPAAGRKVHLVNNTLNPKVDRVVLSDDGGIYTFDDVAPGTGYSVEVLSDNGGVLGQSIRSFEVVSGNKYTDLPAMDIAKGVDTAQTKNDVSVLLADRDSAQGSNISTIQLRELPLYNRTFLALSLIQPGVHDVEQGSPLQGAAFSVAGSRPTSTDFLLNSLANPESIGMDNVASSNNQAIPFQVNEAVQDLRVVYAVPDLRYGQGAGGVIDVVTSQGHVSSKSGIRAWHGSAFEYFNDDSLNRNTPISVYSNSGFFKAAAYATNTTTGTNFNQINLNVPAFALDPGFSGYAPQSYNELVSVVNGPLAGGNTSLGAAGLFNSSPILASHDSFTSPITQSQFGFSAGGPLFGGKLLMFASYEGSIINNPNPIFERVPTSLDTPLQDADGAIAKGIFGLFPKPNVGYGTGSNTSGVLGFYQGVAPNYTHVHNVHIRPDIPLPVGTLSLRYTGQILNQLHDDSLPSGGAYPGNGAFRKAQNQSAAVTYNVPLKRITNIATIGFTQFRVDEVAQDSGFTPPAGLNAGGLSTFVISGIDTQTTGAAPGKPGLMGGWYDSFWNSCSNGGALVAGTTNCLSNTTSRTSPSPITPSLDGDFPLARIGAPLSAPAAHRDTEAYVSDVLEFNLPYHNQLVIGGDYRYQQNFDYEAGLTRGLVVSNNIGEFSSDSETCISCGGNEAFSHPSFDYELRQPSPYVGDLRSSAFGIFLENKMQPTAGGPTGPTGKMTVTYGLRYDYFGEPLDQQGRLWNYSQQAQGLLRQGSSGTYDAFDYQCGVSPATSLDSLYGSRRVAYSNGWNCTPNGNFNLPANKHDLTGRFGISYAVDDQAKTVVRMAVGGYYDHLPASYNETLLKNRPSPYNVSNPSAIYGQNFDSAACPVSGTQCAFGLHTLISSNWATSTFQNNQAASGANILYERDPKNLQTPYSIQFSTGVQHKFGSQWLAEVAYVGSVSHRLPLIYDGNYTNEFYCTQGGGTSTNPGGLCNNNTFFPVFTESHFGSANYQSVILRASSQQWHGLSFHGALTLAKSLDDVAGSQFPQSTDAIWSQLFGRQLFGMGNPVAFALGANSLHAGTSTTTQFGARGEELGYVNPATGIAQNRISIAQTGNLPSFNAVSSALTTTGSRQISVSQYNIPQNPLAFSSESATAGGDYGRSDFDVKSRVVADFVYALPGFGKAWAKGFLVSGIFVGQTGQPFSIFSGPAYGQVTQRISVPAGSSIKVGGGPKGDISGVSQANLAAFSPVNNNNQTCPSLYAKGTLYNNTPSLPQVCVGNSGRNSFTGPAYVSQDLAVEKSTKMWFGESQSFIIRAEFFNLFNRANYYNPISEYSLDGVHVNPEFGLIRSAHDPLSIQLAARYSF